MKKILIIIVLVLAIAAGIILPIAKSQGMLSKGNDEIYSVAQTEALEDSPIKGKRILFLGSSVTYGSAAKGESFVDYLEKKDGIIAVKEAVSGTCLVDDKDNSYVSRLRDIDKNEKFDAVVVQLSTNDATKKKPLGEIGEEQNLDEFDAKTVAGALEYIYCYCRDTWNCPVIFFTGTHYKSKQYDEMVSLLLKLQEKWGYEVLDLWNDGDLNSISGKSRRLFMANGIHPTRAGYREWWLPKFEEKLYTVL